MGLLSYRRFSFLAGLLCSMLVLVHSEELQEESDEDEDLSDNASMSVKKQKKDDTINKKTIVPPPPPPTSSPKTGRNALDTDDPGCIDAKVTGSIPVGVAVGLVVAGIVIGVLVTSLCCCLMYTRWKTMNFGYFGGKKADNTSAHIILENQSAGPCEEVPEVVVDNRDSHMYSELAAVYNEPGPSGEGQYDHTSSHVISVPPPDHMHAYNHVYTPLNEQGRQPGNLRVKDGKGCEPMGNEHEPNNNEAGSLETRDNIVNNPTSDEKASDATGQHEYFVLERRDPENDALNDGRRVESNHENDGTAHAQNESGNDGDGVQHDYFVLERETNVGTVGLTGRIEKDSGVEVNVEANTVKRSNAVELKDGLNGEDDAAGTGDAEDDGDADHAYFVLEKQTVSENI